MKITKQYIESLDKNDSLSEFKNRFFIENKKSCYLDGNSLGRLPKKTIEEINSFLYSEWGTKLVEGWEKWINEAQSTGDLLAMHILGADKGEVLACDTTSVNFYQICSAVVNSFPERKTIITDAANFPTDRYILQGIAQKFDLNLIIIDNERVNEKGYEKLTPDILRPYLNDDVSLVTFQVLQYRSGSLNDIKKITELVRNFGALAVWDASHAAGSVELNFKKNNIDLAVGCTYKYLCSGPGAPAWLYVKKKLQTKLQVPIQGWFAQKHQFEMEANFEKSPDIRGFQIASPSLIGLRSINVACKIIKDAKMKNIIKKAKTGTDLIIKLYDKWLIELGFLLMTPRNSKKRGAHVSLFHENAKSISAALRRFEGVIVDYRTPNQIRIAVSPLSTTYNEIYTGIKKIRASVRRKDYLKIKNYKSRVT